MKNNSKTC